MCVAAIVTARLISRDPREATQLSMCVGEKRTQSHNVPICVADHQSHVVFDVRDKAFRRSIYICHHLYIYSNTPRPPARHPPPSPTRAYTHTHTPPPSPRLSPPPSRTPQRTATTPARRHRPPPCYRSSSPTTRRSAHRSRSMMYHEDHVFTSSRLFVRGMGYLYEGRVCSHELYTFGCIVNIKCNRTHEGASSVARGIADIPPVEIIWAHGVVVSHPLRMRKALGSNPSVSNVACALHCALTYSGWRRVRRLGGCKGRECGGCVVCVGGSGGGWWCFGCA